jgi:hypothetical protein
MTAMMGSVSMATSLANGVYTLSDRIIRSTDSGVTDIKRLITSSDLKSKISIMDLFIKEIDINDTIPYSIKESIESIKIAIKDIEKELKQIQYRIEYNDNLYFTAVGTRAYKFNNSYKRLESKIVTMSTRYETLKSLYSMRQLLNPNRIDKKVSEISIIEKSNSVDKDDKLLETILKCESDEHSVSDIEHDNLKK